ncbi:MAG: hypothetical protein AAGC79_09185 [Pseudomonadota bacterium]
MIVFEDIDDVRDWLDPLDYTAFWAAVVPWAILPEGDREHCDQIIADGTAPQETVLFCLKAMARAELTERFGLDHRIYEPVDRQYLMRTH